MLVFNNDKVMGSVIVFNKNEFEINCKEEDLKEKIKTIEEIIKKNISSNNGWNNNDMYSDRL